MTDLDTPSSEASKTKAPIWFWIFAMLALLWFLMDLMAFIMRIQLPEGSIPEAQLELYQAMPAWVNVVFAVEVFGGLLGALSLLLRKALATQLLTISLIGVLAQTSYVWFLSDAREIMGTSAIVMPLVAIFIGIGLLLLSKKAISKKWVN